MKEKRTVENVFNSLRRNLKKRMYKGHPAYNYIDWENINAALREEKKKAIKNADKAKPLVRRKWKDRKKNY